MLEEEEMKLSLLGKDASECLLHGSSSPRPWPSHPSTQ
jgi:hypothetical protein